MASPEPLGRRSVLRIGVDLDNTIVCYDELFSRLARERGVAAEGLPPSKAAVRAHLCASGREALWTELQGEAYGPRMNEARPYPGAAAFFAECRRRNVEVFIVSHRSRHPYRGERHDLHGAAYRWLADNGFAEDGEREHVCLELEKPDKARRIAALGCTCFVDDLAEFLAEPALPAGLVRIHFDPSGGHEHGDCRASLRCVDSWAAVGELVLRHSRDSPDSSDSGDLTDG